MQLGLFKLGAEQIFLAFPPPASSILPTPLIQHAINIAHHPDRLVDLRRGECERANSNWSGTYLRGCSSESILNPSGMSLSETTPDT